MGFSHVHHPDDVNHTYSPKAAHVLFGTASTVGTADREYIPRTGGG